MGSFETPEEFSERVGKLAREGLANMDIEDMSPLGGLTMAYREVFDEFIKADFTAGQAAYFTCAMFSGNPGIAPGGTT
jgi:hypothetical protein